MVEPRNTTTMKQILEDERPELVKLLTKYEGKFGVGPVWIVSVPARICVAADHTDYWRGFSPELLTMASDGQTMWGVVGPRDDGSVSCSSSDESFDDWSGTVHSSLKIGDDWLEWLRDRGSPAPNWANYIMGSIYRTAIDYDVPFGFNLYVDSSIPPASGASSSSALATMAMMAVRLSNGLPIGREELVTATSEGEWFCGTRGGMQDHATMLFAKVGNFLKLGFRPFSYEYIAVPRNISDKYWVTIFTHPSDKGGDVLNSFNRLALVAREIVPRILGEWKPDDADELLDKLPEKIVLNDFCAEYSCRGIEGLYPALFDDEAASVDVKDRFRFAMNEYERCQSTQRELGLERCSPDVLGGLLIDSWNEAGDYYGIRTELMDDIADAVLQTDGVYGVKVMGAGFGGNLLALCDADVNLSSIDSDYHYHRPGGGVSIFDTTNYLPSVPPSRASTAAVILCGGKGSRMKERGINEHKPLISLNGVPSTRIVLEMLQNHPIGVKQMILVTPPELAARYRDEFADLPVSVVAQPDALGTGNAVYCALGELEDSIEHIYVTFGTQPLVREESVSASHFMHVSSGAGFTMPTTIRNHPYAPLIRDEKGEVVGSLETHLDGVEVPEWGETNVGGYWVSRAALDNILTPLHHKLFDENLRTYSTKSGELGFPNEMTKGCLHLDYKVVGFPCSDPEEVIGLKSPNHIEDIEGWLTRRLRWSNDWVNL